MRWEELSDRPWCPVALVPTGRQAHRIVPDLAERLVEAGRQEGLEVALVSPQDLDRHSHGDPAPMTLVAAPPPGGATGGERVAGECDVMVLVAPLGQRLAAVRDASITLDDVGAAPAWIVLTQTRRRRRRDGAPPARPQDSGQVTTASE